MMIWEYGAALTFSLRQKNHQMQNEAIEVYAAKYQIENEHRRRL